MSEQIVENVPAAAPAPAPTIRAARPDDVAAVEQLLASAGLPTAGVAEILADRAGDFLVVEGPAGDGELVAAAGLEVRGEDALLRSVAVHPEWRTRGLGRELVGRLVRDAEGRGLRALYLLTTTAEDYFPRFGFARVARAAVPAAIADTVEFRGACPASATVMARLLVQGVDARASSTI